MTQNVRETRLATHAKTEVAESVDSRDLPRDVTFADPELEAVRSPRRSSKIEEERERNQQSPHYQPAVIALVSFASGILADYALDWEGIAWFLIAFVAFVSALVARVGWASSRASERGPSRSSIHHALWMMIAISGLGAFWHHAHWNWFSRHEIGRVAGPVAKPVCLEGVLNSESGLMAKPPASAFTYQRDEARTRFEFEVKRIRNGLHWETASGKADLFVHADASALDPGARVRLFGQLVRIQPPRNPGQVDYAYLMRSQKELVAIHVYSLDSIESLGSHSHGWVKWRSELRRFLNELIWNYVGEEQAGLASAILLGNRDQLTDDERESFLVTGTVHLLAISGLHVGILAGVIFFLFRVGLLGRQQFLVATIVFVFFYSWLVEFRPPVIRSAILIGLLCFARLIGKRAFSFNWLSFAGLVVLLINPTSLFGLGPQLSFLAVGTILFARDWVFWKPSNDPLDRLIANTRPVHVRWLQWMGRKVRVAFLVGAVIWLVALPLVAYRFHLVTPVALMLNPILLIPIGIALYAGLGVLVFGYWLPPVGKMLGAICHANLQFVEDWVEWGEGLDWGHFWTPGPSGEAVLVFYIMIWLLAIFPLTRQPLKVCVFAVFGWWIVGWVAIGYFTHSTARDVLRSTFVDVGHGTGVVLQLPAGGVMIYDAGGLGSARYAASNISGVLWEQGFSHVDTVIISHGDLDHLNALPVLLERFSIGCVCISGPMSRDESPKIRKLLELVVDHGVKIEVLSRGQRFDQSGVQFEVLHPADQGTGGNNNSNSIVLSATYGEHQLLLAGDLENEGMAALLESKPRHFDLVMAPHHGSRRSQPELLADWATPGFMVISASAKKANLDVVQAWEADGIDVLGTYQNGAVIAELGDSVKVFHWSPLKKGDSLPGNR